MTDNLNDTLLDVRKAYRLLADYQQHMLELLAFIRERLGADDYYHRYAQTLPQGLQGLEQQEHSGMRFLPFYDLSAIWLKNKGREEPWNDHLPGDLMYGAWVRTDTGFDKFSGAFDSLPVEQTSSVLVLSVVVCDQPLAKPCNWYGSIWRNMDYPEDGGVNGTDVPGYRCFAKAIPLDQLGSKADIETALESWRAAASRALDFPVA